MLKNVRIALWAACALPLLALLAVAGLELTHRANGGGFQASGIGGPFKLASSSGGELSSEDSEGRALSRFLRLHPLSGRLSHHGFRHLLLARRARA